MNAGLLIHWLLEDATNTFVSAVLTPASQSRLLRAVPPVHPTVFAHHATIAFKPEAADLERYLEMHGQPVRIPVTAVAVDDKAQAVLVGIDSENEYPHITISVAEGVKPVYSNELMASADLQHIPIFTLEATIVVEALL